MFCSLSPAFLAGLLALQAPAQPAGQAAGQQAGQAAGQPATQAAGQPAGRAAQDPFETAPPPRPVFRLRPGIGLLDVGLDTNIFGTANDPVQDTIGRLQLRAAPSVETGSVSLNGTAALSLSYFQQHTSQRSVDTNDAFRLEYRLNRVTLYSADSFLRTRDIFSPELDVRLPRTENSVEGGVDVRVTGKTRIVAGLRHAGFDFGTDALSSFDLHDSLTRSEDTVTASMRNAVTPLTTVVVGADIERDRFDFSSFRNADGVRVMSGFEFAPTALLSGKAYVGYRRRMSSNGNYPNAGTVVASLDLGYNPWAPIRFGLKVDRDLDHSFMAAEQYYIVTGVTGSVTAKLGEAWELGGMVGRQRLDYRASTLPDFNLAGQLVFNAAPWAENMVQLGGTVAYRIALGAVFRVKADYVRRDSAVVTRTYDRLRLVSSITFGFE